MRNENEEKEVEWTILNGGKRVPLQDNLLRRTQEKHSIDKELSWKKVQKFFFLALVIFPE